MTRFSVIFAFSALLIAEAPTEPPPAQDLILHIDVNLVQIDAVVYDRKGHSVTDLKPEDFEVLEDGKVQPITAFSYVQLNGGRVPSAGGKALPAPTERLTPQQVKRTIVLVADDLNLSFESTAQLHIALKKYLDTQMGPNDLVSIARTSTGLGALENFTNDKRALYAAVDAVRWNPNGRAGISAIPSINSQIGTSNRGRQSQEGSTSRPRAAAGDDDSVERDYLYARGAMNSISAIIDDLRPLPGRKAIILFSDGVPIVPRGDHIDLIQKLLRRVADLANRSSVVLNCVDARGLQTLTGQAGDNFGGSAAGGGVSEAQTTRALDFSDEQNGLIYLASQTGGRAVLNGNNINWAIDRVLEDLDGYYLIGYRPQSGTFHKEGEDPAFHRLHVRVKSPGLTVRSRTGFYGITNQEAAPAPTTDGQKLLTALQSPFGANEIPLRLTVEFLSDGAKHSSLSTLLHIDGHAIEFQKRDDDKYHARVELLLTGYDENGRAVEGADNIFEMALPTAEYQAALTNGFVYTQQVPINRKGAAHVRVAVRDMVSGRLGSTSQFVLLPDLKKGRMVIGTLIMGGTDAATGLSNPAIRIFKTDQPMPYKFSILNPRIKGDSAKVETQVRVFHEGKEVWASKPAEAGGKTAKDARTLVASSALHLANGFQPGEYYLQVIARDLHAGGKAPLETQWIGFELERE